MIHVNQDLLQQHGILSLRGLQVTVALPECYVATSVSDFLEHKDELIPTRWKPLNPGRKYNGFTIVCFASCSLRQIKEISADELEQRIEECTTDVLLESLYGRLKPRIREKDLDISSFDDMKNVELFDLAASFRAYTPHEIERTRIYEVFMRYSTQLGFGKIMSYSDIPTPAQDNMLERFLGLPLLNPV